DKHGALTFPAGTVERAHQDGFTQCILDEIDAVLWTAARHSFALPEDKRLPEIKDSLRWEYARNINRITDQIRGPYLMGESFTLADIILAHCGGWAKSARFPADNEAFGAYLKRCRARPAFLRLAER
uniref:glutathione S-transferase family protein n=1 Tax=Shimia sp. TaxID=1954381 RepID=UPI003564E28B